MYDNDRVNYRRSKTCLTMRVNYSQWAQCRGCLVRKWLAGRREIWRLTLESRRLQTLLTLWRLTSCHRLMKTKMDRRGRRRRRSGGGRGMESWCRPLAIGQSQAAALQLPETVKHVTSWCISRCHTWRHMTSNFDRCHCHCVASSTSTFAAERNC